MVHKYTYAYHICIYHLPNHPPNSKTRRIWKFGWCFKKEKPYDATNLVMVSYTSNKFWCLNIWGLKFPFQKGLTIAPRSTKKHFETGKEYLATGKFFFEEIFFFPISGMCKSPGAVTQQMVSDIRSFHGFLTSQGCRTLQNINSPGRIFDFDGSVYILYMVIDRLFQLHCVSSTCR